MTVAHRAAVCGKPIGHSLSPVIHSAGFAAAGLLDWAYTAVECAEAELAALVGGLGAEWAGLSLTMPLKEVALTVAASASPAATAVGAANTLVRRADGRWHADNTDIAGIIRVLRDAGISAGTATTRPRPAVSSASGQASDAAIAGPDEAAAAGFGGAAPAGAGAAGEPTRRIATVTGDVAPGGAPPRFTVLGGGGTARAALAAAAHLGAGRVTVVTRRRQACDELAVVAAALGLTLDGVDWTDASSAFDADVVISTVPKGAADALATAVSWRPGTVLFDAIYDPWPTPLAAAAAANGCPVVSGLDLLLAQALAQFEQFTGVRPAPEAAMRSALLAAAVVG